MSDEFDYDYVYHKITNHKKFDFFFLIALKQYSKRSIIKLQYFIIAKILLV